jgi:hypothetical protein
MFSSNKTRFGFQKYYPKKSFFVGCALLAILILTVVAIAFIYLSSEKAFYFWDFSNYSKKTSNLAATFQQSPLQAIKVIRRSLDHGYNRLPGVIGSMR